MQTLLWFFLLGRRLASPASIDFEIVIDRSACYYMHTNPNPSFPYFRPAPLLLINSVGSIYLPDPSAH